jgi:hypothetical protein
MEETQPKRTGFDAIAMALTYSFHQLFSDKPTTAKGTITSAKKYLAPSFTESIKGVKK